MLTIGGDQTHSTHLWKTATKPPPPLVISQNGPPETDAPPASLYGTSSERCFIIGNNVASNESWHMNSRALCSLNSPICLNGNQLQHVYTFAPRGSASCDIAAVANQKLVRADTHGLNESCAAFRRRHVIKIYGDEKFAELEPFLDYLGSKTFKDPKYHAASWHSDFAIIVPKYPWSWNICHYNRIWNFVIYVIRNLSFFAPHAPRNTSSVDVLFRSGYQYTSNWPRGLREVTIPAVEKETGLKIRVGQIRHDIRREFQCVRRGILLGDEGRVDAFPFFNDTDICSHEEQKNDNHWPTIPDQALWTRHATYTSLGMDDGAKFDGPGISNFRSIPVPPKRVVFLKRNPKSPRRLTTLGKVWFEKTLSDLARQHGFEVRHVRFRKEMSLGDQVKQVRDVGLAVGLHGANMVNTMFMPAGSAMFEIFPWRYVRAYYAGGLNSGLRYSYHEPETGVDKHCSFDTYCFMRYRESVIYLSQKDRNEVQRRISNAMTYIIDLNTRFPNGSIPLEKHGNFYSIPKPQVV